MKIIRKAVVFSADMPPAKNMEEHMEALRFRPCGAADISSLGFVENPFTGEMLTPLPGAGYSFTVQFDAKILPRAAVLKALREAERLAEEERDEPLDEQEHGELEEKVMSDLIARALIKTTLIYGFFHADKRLMVIQASRPLAQRVGGLVVKACGALKTHTIHIDDVKGGLTTRLKAHLAGSERAFSNFDLGQSCLLRDKGGRASFEFLGELLDLDEAQQGLEEALASGKQVERIELRHGTMAFRIAKDFTFSGVQYFGSPEPEDDEPMDKAMEWRLEAAAQLLQLGDAIGDLCTLFDYDPELNLVQ